MSRYCSCRNSNSKRSRHELCNIYNASSIILKNPIVLTIRILFLGGVMEEEIRFYFSYDKYEELLEKLKK